ncbi:hypothetical protein NKG05_12395 [Oerskovia sp. M15]
MATGIIVFAAVMMMLAGLSRPSPGSSLCSRTTSTSRLPTICCSSTPPPGVDPPVARPARPVRELRSSGGKVWGRTIGIILASLSALANFTFIPYYPVWSLVVIALDVFVIWALAAHGRDIVR